MVNDRFTGAPRGLAFLQFHSVSDASMVLKRMHGAVLEGQTTPLNVCYARDKFGGPGTGALEGSQGPNAADAAGVRIVCLACLAVIPRHVASVRM
jgi:RNA-binding protein 5/10